MGLKVGLLFPILKSKKDRPEEDLGMRSPWASMEEAEGLVKACNWKLVFRQPIPLRMFSLLSFSFFSLLMFIADASSFVLALVNTSTFFGSGFSCFFLLFVLLCSFLFFMPYADFLFLPQAK
jgi:hypothetical protein